MFNRMFHRVSYQQCSRFYTVAYLDVIIYVLVFILYMDVILAESYYIKIKLFYLLYLVSKAEMAS